ncbi:moulting cycle domain-containing protein [Ditylenchus destructor]|uniref:Moulting cycle domain-containing protein n=1 Tax=Ditylenchus destructor TaxID=166010 RepID=A0AAD4MQ44_9BILA|nr:moulting cycle domain-containing protein [Ditylenchus destructor]
MPNVLAASPDQNQVHIRVDLIVSPRFLNVVPEEEQSKTDTVDFLSPSLFALHNKGKDVEQAASLPNLMRNFSVGDQDKWMDLIMEAAGVVEQVEKLDTDYKKAENMEEYKKKYEKEFRAKDGTPLYFTPENVTKTFGQAEQRKIDTHVNLSQSLSKEQVLLIIFHTVIDVENLLGCAIFSYYVEYSCLLWNNPESQQIMDFSGTMIRRKT